MSSPYRKLISLAEEVDAPSTAERVAELNTLLASLSVDNIKRDHLALLDDLISIMSITNNLDEERRDTILDLQDKIRSTIT